MAAAEPKLNVDGAVAPDAPKLKAPADPKAGLSAAAGAVSFATLLRKLKVAVVSLPPAGAVLEKPPNAANALFF